MTMDDKDKLWLIDELDKRDMKHERDHDQIKSMLVKIGFSLLGMIAVLEIALKMFLGG